MKLRGRELVEQYKASQTPLTLRAVDVDYPRADQQRRLLRGVTAINGFNREISESIRVGPGGPAEVYQSILFGQKSTRMDDADSFPYGHFPYLIIDNPTDNQVLVVLMNNMLDRCLMVKPLTYRLRLANNLFALTSGSPSTADKKNDVEVMDIAVFEWVNGDQLLEKNNHLLEYHRLEVIRPYEYIIYNIGGQNTYYVKTVHYKLK